MAFRYQVHARRENVVPGIAPRASWVAGSNTTIPMLTAASASWSAM
jgi:hypothetical protein